MAKITFEDQTYTCNPSESVLECLRRHGVAYPYSCQNGVCQSCLSRSRSGTPPEESQQGLKPTQVAQNYFLACICHPAQDLEISLPSASEENIVLTKVTEKAMLNRDIIKLSLACPEGYSYFPGQFLNLQRNNVLIRSYSIASVPQLNESIELHIRKLENGRVSNWIHDELSVGDEVAISEAKGDCFYTPGHPEQDLLLIGTGSGLAPLYAIALDALNKGHTGQIKLYHGSHNRAGLYFVKELQELAKQHDNFHYIGCVSNDAESTENSQGRANDVALQENPELKNWRVFLCGHPDMVAQSKKQVFLAGASFSDIYADPFLISA